MMQPMYPGGVFFDPKVNNWVKPQVANPSWYEITDKPTGQPIGPGSNPPFTTNSVGGNIPINTLPGNPAGSGSTGPSGSSGGSSGSNPPYSPSTNPPFSTRPIGGGVPINTLPGNPTIGNPGGVGGPNGGGGGLPPTGTGTGGGAGGGMIPGSAALPGMFQDPANWSGAPGTNFHVLSGISAGPIWSPEQTQAGADAIRNAPQTLTHQTRAATSGPQQSAALQQLSDFTSQGNSRASLGFLRDASQANAKEQLDSERARAFAGGLPWMNLVTSQRQAEGQEQLRSTSQLVQMLMQLMG